MRQIRKKQIELGVPNPCDRMFNSTLIFKNWDQLQCIRLYFISINKLFSLYKSWKGLSLLKHKPQTKHVRKMVSKNKVQMKFCICCIQNTPPALSWARRQRGQTELLISAQSSLLLSVLHDFFFHIQSLSLSHCIHVLAGLVLRVCLLPKVQILLLSRRDPERVTWNDLQKETNKTRVK